MTGWYDWIRCIAGLGSLGEMGKPDGFGCWMGGTTGRDELASLDLLGSHGLFIKLPSLRQIDTYASMFMK